VDPDDPPPTRRWYTPRGDPKRFKVGAVCLVICAAVTVLVWLRVLPITEDAIYAALVGVPLGLALTVEGFFGYDLLADLGIKRFLE